MTAERPIENCSINIPASPDDITPGDNSFHCPFDGEYVELTRNDDGEPTCNSPTCNQIDITK